MVNAKCTVCGSQDNLTIHHVNGRRNDKFTLQIVCYNCHMSHNKNHGVYGIITEETIKPSTHYPKDCPHDIIFEKEVKLTTQEICQRCGILIAIKW